MAYMGRGAAKSYITLNENDVMDVSRTTPQITGHGSRAISVWWWFIVVGARDEEEISSTASRMYIHEHVGQEDDGFY